MHPIRYMSYKLTKCQNMQLINLDRVYRLNKKIFMRILVIVVLFISPTYLAFSQQVESKQFPIQNDSLINNWLSENSIPALGIGIIKNSQITQIKVYGNLTHGKPAPYNSIFKVASLTKPIVGMVTLELISKGGVNLNDKLSDFWIDPDIEKNPLHDSLTVKHVLTHQTGFKNWRRLNENSKLDFDFNPGTKFQYSGEGYEYLRKYLEKRFSTTIEELSDSLIFRPLGMIDTKFSWKENVDTSRYALNHDKNGKLIPTLKNMEANGADHLLSTIEDYSKFGLYVLNGGFLSNELYDEMITKQVTVNKYSSFGLGWEIVPDLVNGSEVIMHSGSDPGARSLIVLDTKSGTGIILFSNSDNGGWEFWEDFIMSFFK